MMTPLRRFKSFLNIEKEHINQVKGCVRWLFASEELNAPLSINISRKRCYLNPHHWIAVSKLNKYIKF